MATATRFPDLITGDPPSYVLNYAMKLFETQVMLGDPVAVELKHRWDLKVQRSNELALEAVKIRHEHLRAMLQARNEKISEPPMVVIATDPHPEKKNKNILERILAAIKS